MRAGVAIRYAARFLASPRHRFTAGRRFGRAGRGPASERLQVVPTARHDDSVAVRELAPILVQSCKYRSRRILAGPPASIEHASGGGNEFPRTLSPLMIVRNASEFLIPRRRMYAATPLRQLRLSHGIRLSDVADRVGISLTRASRIERDPSSATQTELDAMTTAVEDLAIEFDGGRADA